MISSRVQIAVEIVAFPSWISVCAFPSHTSVPWESPAIRIRSEKYFGLRINQHLHGKIRTKLRDSQASKFTSSDILRLDLQCFCAGKQGHDIPSDPAESSRALIPVRSSSIRIMVGSSCPRISSFSRFASMEW